MTLSIPIIKTCGECDKFRRRSPAPPGYRWDYYDSVIPTWQLTGPDGVAGLVQLPMQKWVCMIGDSVLDDSDDACSGELERVAQALIGAVT